MSSSFTKEASMPSSFTTFSTVAYSALHLLQPVPKTLISIFLFVLLFVRKNTNILCINKNYNQQQRSFLGPQLQKNLPNSSLASTQFLRLIQYFTFGASI